MILRKMVFILTYIPGASGENVDILELEASRRKNWILSLRDEDSLGLTRGKPACCAYQY